MSEKSIPPVTSEINGEDTLSFKIPYRDGKRGYIDSEKKIQIVDDVYKVRTVTDTRDTDGSAVTEVYAEAEFYDLTFSVRKEERTFEAEYPETAMAYAGGDGMERRHGDGAYTAHLDQHREKRLIHLGNVPSSTRRRPGR